MTGRIARWVRRHWKLSLAIYAIVLVLNAILMGELNYGRMVWGSRYLESIGGLGVKVDPGTDSVTINPLGYMVAIHGDTRDEDRPPVLLMHGSPGAAIGFDTLADELTKTGRGVIVLDLPGFASAIDYEGTYKDFSAETYAHIMFGVLDEIGVERAHIVGWSNGGAVALRMIEQDDSRIASLTMMASVGLQETEGSGSYTFEHGKYLAGYGALVWGGYVLPPIGLLGPPAETRAFLLNFHHTDQRELRPIMESLETPTLILHGRNDFLVPRWGAERHHDLIPTSRLVMLDASHFLPFLHAQTSAGILEEHFTRHDTPGVPPLTDYDNRAPLPQRTGVASWVESLGVWMRDTRWWVLSLLIAGVALHRPMFAAVLCGMYVGRVDLDLAVAWVGVFTGMLLRKRTVFESRRFPVGWVGTAWWAFASMGMVFVLEQDTVPLRVGPDDAVLGMGAVGLLAWVVLGPIVLHVVGRVPRRRGRQQLRAQWSRLTNHEWWASWVIYLGVLPIWIGRVFHKNGVAAFTAANPGIAHGGGFIGESKDAILRALPKDPRVLAFESIDQDGTPAERADRALKVLDDRSELGGLPVILKPDTGERGRSVKLAKTTDEVREYFDRVPDVVQVQRFDPGPCEFGVFWVRNTDHAEGRETVGTITGITRKVFTEIHGDGKRTLEQLVLAHPRLRCQADVFRDRFSGRWGEVLPPGESVRAGQAGNHCQGCRFEDGTGLVTPELLAAIDSLASGFSGLDGDGLGGIDYARFDVRGVSEEAMQRGEFAVIEVNGVTSEPTHLYDPAMPATRAWGILRDHWRHLYRVADARIEAGAKPLSARATLAMWWIARKRDSIRAD